MDIIDRPHVYLARIKNYDTLKKIAHPNPTPTVDKKIIDRECQELIDQQENPEQWYQCCQLEYTDELGGRSE